MKENLLKISMLSFVTAALLFSGCQKSPNQDSNTTISPQETINNLQSTSTDMVSNTAKTIVSPATIKTPKITQPVVMNERISLEKKYDKKIAECYTSGATDCSKIISEMAKATALLEIKETMASEKLQMQQEMLSQVQMQLPTTAEVNTTMQTLTNLTQGVTNAL